MMNEHQIRERQKELLDEYWKLSDTDTRKLKVKLKFNTLQEVMGGKEYRVNWDKGDDE